MCSPFISYVTSKENSSKYQNILSLVITSLILITSIFEQVLKMWRELLFLSLLGFKGLLVIWQENI